MYFMITLVGTGPVYDDVTHFIIIIAVYSWWRQLWRLSWVSRAMWVSAWCKINCFLISYHYEGCFCLTNSVGDGCGDSAYLRLLFDVMKTIATYCSIISKRFELNLMSFFKSSSLLALWLRLQAFSFHNVGSSLD